jgi:hypothetical protein
MQMRAFRQRGTAWLIIAVLFWYLQQYCTVRPFEAGTYRRSGFDVEIFTSHFQICVKINKDSRVLHRARTSPMPKTENSAELSYDAMQVFTE